VANNYTHFSVIVPVDDPESAVATIVAALDAAHENDGAPAPDCQLFASLEAVWGGLIVEATEDGATERGVWIADDAGEGDVELASTIISWLLRQPGAPRSIDLEWASTCSKPRVGEFGGGACRVLADRVVWNSNPCTALDFFEAVTAEAPVEPALIPGLDDVYDDTAGVRFLPVAGPQGQVGFRCVRDDGAVSYIYLVASTGSGAEDDSAHVFLYQDDGQCANAVHHYDIEFPPQPGEDLLLVNVALHLPTLDEAIKRFGDAPRCLDNRDATRLAAWLPTSRWREIGLTIRDDADPVALAEHDASVEAWNAVVVAEQIRRDVAFGFEKALDQRGISASLMHSVVEMWLRILGIRDEFTETYAQYGLPLFREVAVRYGLPNPIGDDTGEEGKYEG
jgi:hypothetical protein